MNNPPEMTRGVALLTHKSLSSCDYYCWHDYLYRPFLSSRAIISFTIISYLFYHHLFPPLLFFSLSLSLPSNLFYFNSLSILIALFNIVCKYNKNCPFSYFSLNDFITFSSLQGNKRNKIPNLVFSSSFSLTFSSL